MLSYISSKAVQNQADLHLQFSVVRLSVFRPPLLLEASQVLPIMCHGPYRFGRKARLANSREKHGAEEVQGM